MPRTYKGRAAFTAALPLSLRQFGTRSLDLAWVWGCGVSATGTGQEVKTYGNRRIGTATAAVVISCEPVENQYRVSHGSGDLDGSSVDEKSA
jgi:hypothetical protein